MYPHERSLVKKLAGQPFVLLGVNSDGDRDKLRSRLKEESITWRSWWDGGDRNGPIARAFKVEDWPTRYVIDHRGIIRARFVGSASAERLDSLIDTLLKEATRARASDQSRFGSDGAPPNGLRTDGE